MHQQIESLKSGKSLKQIKSLKSGFISNLPVAASVMAYGSVLGMLASQKNIAATELMFMNIAVFAGSAQFVMVDMWQDSLHIFEITMAVLIMNLRYLLIGASLKPLFKEKGIKHKMAMMHLVADENWAVTMAEYKKGGTDTYFLFGGGVCLLIAWCSGTIAGHALGSLISNPELYALDFAFTAVFTALAFSMWEGKKNIIPWLSAALLAVAAEKILPGKWYIVIGGAGGSLVAALLSGKEESEKGENNEQ